MPSTIAQIVLADVAAELKTTRRLLERVPDEQFGWRPHAKSMTLGRLATHLADIPALAYGMLQSDVRDMAASTGGSPELTTTADVLARYDTNAANLLGALDGVEDSVLARDWTLRHGTNVVLALPTTAALRSLGVNHHIHHRGQLSVYLRLLDVSVPSIYGPSADEPN